MHKRAAIAAIAAITATATEATLLSPDVAGRLQAEKAKIETCDAALKSAWNEADFNNVSALWTELEHRKSILTLGFRAAPYTAWNAWTAEQKVAAGNDAVSQLPQGAENANQVRLEASEAWDPRSEANLTTWLEVCTMGPGANPHPNPNPNPNANAGQGGPRRRVLQPTGLRECRRLLGNGHQRRARRATSAEQARRRSAGPSHLRPQPRPEG